MNAFFQYKKGQAMSDLSNYLEDALLNAVFRNTTYTSPATVYAALFTVAPGEAGGGTEVTGGGYARKSITFGAPSSNTIANTNDVTWTPSGANYGTVLAVGIFDASSAGNLLAYKTITSQVVNDGNTFHFPAASLTVNLN